MAYLQRSGWRDRPAAVIGVVAIHAAVGYALVTGLDFEKFVEAVKNPEGINVVVPLPPPPPDPVPTPQPDAFDPPIVVPVPPVPLPNDRPRIDSTPIIEPTPDIRPHVTPLPTPQPDPSPRPSLAPESARPRGNPAGWVTVNDYRSSWINRDMTGTARFRLEVAPTGRVANCTITGSSGHPELDRATCALVSQRARFEPARDGSGNAVSGSYVNSVRWELPG